MMVDHVLPWLNLLLLPMAYHIIRTESRITRLEALVEMLLKREP